MPLGKQPHPFPIISGKTNQVLPLRPIDPDPIANMGNDFGVGRDDFSSQLIKLTLP